MAHLTKTFALCKCAKQPKTIFGEAKNLLRDVGHCIMLGSSAIFGHVNKLIGMAPFALIYIT